MQFLGWCLQLGPKSKNKPSREKVLGGFNARKEDRKEGHEESREENEEVGFVSTSLPLVIRAT